MGRGAAERPEQTDDKRERLDKIVAAAGLGSRREVRAWIRAGRVTVDGRPVLDPAFRTFLRATRVELDGRPVDPGPVTVMLHKPRGVITATVDAHQRTVTDLLPPPLARRLFPAGRLDKDSEGLLILTDDGSLCHRIISPRRGIEKEYEVEVDGKISPELEEIFREGITLADGYVTRPARLRTVDPGPPGRARVTITEGKYHQVRRMFAACGLTVTALRRVRIGSLPLDEGLAPGDFRFLREPEIQALLRNPRGESPDRGGAGRG